MEEDYATLWKSKMDVWEKERAWDEERGELGGEREQVTVYIQVFFVCHKIFENGENILASFFAISKVS